MTIDTRNLLIEKAKTKKDGVYLYRCFLYVVKNNNFIAFANYYGECFQCMGAFNYSIGTVEKYDRKKKLTEWLKKQ